MVLVYSTVLGLLEIELGNWKLALGFVILTVLTGSLSPVVSCSFSFVLLSLVHLPYLVNMSLDEEATPSGTTRMNNSGLERQWCKRLKTFSGRKNPASNELDFETWEFELNELDEETLLDNRCKRRIVLGSLIPPASNLARSIGTNSDIDSILKVLKSAYGKVTTGHELLMKFYDTIQKAEEKPSKYLQRLQAQVRRIVDNGEIQGKLEFESLVKQFRRGCNDETLLHQMNLMGDLRHLEHRNFTDLFCALVEEETRLSDKQHRLEPKDKPKAVSKPQVSVSVEQSEIAALKEQVNALSLRLEQATGNNNLNTNNLSSFASGRGRGAHRNPNAGYRQRSRPPAPANRIMICYNCGGEGHSFRDCEAPPNPQLVCDILKGKRSGNDSESV